MSPSLVTVVIPFVNHRQYLERAIDSVRAQTYKHIEILLVDNNSTDGTGQLARELAQAHPREIRYLHQPVKGIPFARNKGLAEASGDYISFLDVDDEFVATKFADQVSILDAHPEVALVYGMTRRIYLPEGREVIQDVGLAREGVNAPPDLGIDWLRIFYRLPQTGATLARTAIAREVGGFGENLLLGNDDVAYHLRLALNYQVWFHPQEAVHYYRHTQSEGAQLNREMSVTARYLDAYANWVAPYTVEFARRTGDDRPRYWAERSLAGNLVRHAQQKAADGRERRCLLAAWFREQRRRGLLQGRYFQIYLGLHYFLPEEVAKFFTRVYDRLVNLWQPERYPLDFTYKVEEA